MCVCGGGERNEEVDNRMGANFHNDITVQRVFPVGFITGHSQNQIARKISGLILEIWFPQRTPPPHYTESLSNRIEIKLIVKEYMILCYLCVKFIMTPYVPRFSRVRGKG